jgi:hypothetical protein
MGRHERTLAVVEHDGTFHGWVPGRAESLCGCPFHVLRPTGMTWPPSTEQVCDVCLATHSAPRNRWWQRTNPGSQG